MQEHIESYCNEIKVVWNKNIYTWNHNFFKCFSGYHGVGGPQTVHRPRYQAEMKDPLFRTVKHLGYKVVDPNGPRQTGKKY